ncbi:RidA family protein [Pleomorphomonas sp. NRK KF1]|uniref:RidA family protein n=1 Tax=Pleomorphomonas sp. NRK KF1 TaxID=2943000 RepID=UPI002044679E|nr:RidA family protein [Pleomorphomonas sp. NRK KF1]MCM5554224.1 RidA family protein [Pleomorphomonas sp. NRK KF1]
MRQLISTGSPFEAVAGYSRAVVDGPWCFVSGTTGYDYATMTMPGDISQQAENAMATIARALDDAGFSISDVVRVRYIITDAAHADPVFSVVGRWFADTRPAATMMVAGLIRPEMKVEIEATAFRNPA